MNNRGSKGLQLLAARALLTAAIAFCALPIARAQQFVYTRIKSVPPFGDLDASIGKNPDGALLEGKDGMLTAQCFPGAQTGARMEQYSE